MSVIFEWTKDYLKKKDLAFLSVDETLSTNDLAKKEAFRKNLDFKIYLAKKQTKGRGQEGKTWIDSDLMISFLWRRDFKTLKKDHALFFTKDLKKALEETFKDLNFEVKKINDLLLNKKKLSGLLLEVLREGERKALVLGLGMNVFSSPKSLPAISLKEAGAEVKKKEWFFFLDEMIRLFRKRVDEDF